LQYFNAVSGGRLACMPLELKLRGKSTAMSHRAAIYYVDLVVRSGFTLEKAIGQARELGDLRKGCGFDQDALDEAARAGFANGVFEELTEDLPEVAEEFYPNGTAASGQAEEPQAASTGLRGRLQERVARLGGE
jgi:hypothetical protein